MILILRISSMLALVLGCLLLAVAGIRWFDNKPAAAWSREIPAVADRLAQIGDQPVKSSTTSPLIAQAEAFAALLAPPGVPEPSPVQTAAAPVSEVAEAAPPVAVMLKLYATSCYPDQPEKSMALVSETGPQEQRWVKEGSRFGSFHIHEIHRGEIIYREGDLLHEVAIDPGVSQPSIVRDTRAGSRRVSDAVRPLPSVAGPNDVGITGD